MFVESYGKKNKIFFNIIRFSRDSLVSERNDVYIKNAVSDTLIKKSTLQKTQKAKRYIENTGKTNHIPN
jgi:hypothetical protein